MTLEIILLIFLAYLFDFLNGFHDSANSIATVVSTRVLSPRIAVIWAAFFNFIAFLFFGLHVANTIGKGIIDINIVDKGIIFGTLMGACGWNIITWYFGLPTSSSHALIGGMIGAALVKSGPVALVWKGIMKTIVFIFISPILGLILGLAFGLMVYWLFRKNAPSKVDHIFRKGQLVSAALYSLGHGGNDAQKTMGIIASLLFSAGFLGTTFHIPTWIVITCHMAIALGTMFGGWRIVKTMGQKVAKLKPVDGFCAESGAAITLFMSSALGVPVSTTHTITGAIMGVGSIRRLTAVKWGVAGNIIKALTVTGLTA
ncbi:MAG TPA: inorganic phosphate transporter, partial [Candidatus Omnitrophota bacterium]|nr:inorganic phosphate transporter [Candidatus Omnitrophota bacterium]